MKLYQILEVMKDAEMPITVRLDAARDPAPYRHSKLQSIMHNLGNRPQTALDEFLKRLDGTQRGIPNAVGAKSQLDGQAITLEF